ncbi:uncharacterized protein MYCFIDRAFT_176098 [Pseudocercospora fijiensis CIRAD86]|uniref:Uncharacterized protein n=1 Tax=Pseudocercospora fijiensis (strain CIRAD86) TaxID=383855 RepID=M3ATB8_PSEFD|nr:uncharacterized protein MYCFIDRAFT_176098 [Pseudocercospora fijiensis CIRAD86]EME80717.1 hypothetical protein MYCFIDRAFT_176098 [Pseudocercospora fijiensis CIRAD86]
MMSSGIGRNSAVEDNGYPNINNEKCGELEHGYTATELPSHLVDQETAVTKVSQLISLRPWDKIRGTKAVEAVLTICVVGRQVGGVRQRYALVGHECLSSCEEILRSHGDTARGMAEHTVQHSGLLDISQPATCCFDDEAIDMVCGWYVGRCSAIG